MMPFFPVPYEDEVLYSVLARYHLRSGNTSYKATMNDAFGTNSVTAVMDLPSNLDRLIENLPIYNRYTTDYLIHNHTLFPFYSAFIPEDRAAQVIDSMKGDTGGSIYSRIGVMASSIAFNQYFKFCPECSKEDKKMYGELYWHRVHQIPGVLVCSKHNVFLQDSSVPVRGYNKHEYMAAEENNCIDKECNIGCSDKTFEKLILISQDAQALLNNSFIKREIPWFKEQYLATMMDKGYATVNGKVNQKELTDAFVDFYGEELLNLLQSGIDTGNDANWLTDMVRKKNRVNHPIRHLLMARFLDIPINDLFDKKIEYKPFGDGPWPCLNAAADHYMEPVVDNIKIVYGTDSKSPVATFMCSCGFIYLRSSPDSNQADRYKAGRILHFGPVWEARLKELIDKNLSLREIARNLKVDANTVNKYALKLGLNTPWRKSGGNKINNMKEEGNTLVTVDNVEKSTKINRDKWIILMQQYPDMGKTELRMLDKRLYMRLYKSDREWLNKNCPDKKPTNIINLRIDWIERDEEILMRVKALVGDMLNNLKKPERVSISLVGSKLGLRGLFERHLDKLPKTMEYLNSVKESDADYRIRRIKWAINELSNEGQDLKLWKVYRKAGIRKEYQADLEQEIIWLIKDNICLKNSIGE